MRIGYLRVLIEGRGDEEQDFVALYERSEANEYVFNNCVNGEDEPAITDDEWNFIVDKMSDDTVLWEALNEAFNYYVDKTIEKRKA